MHTLVGRSGVSLVLSLVASVAVACGRPETFQAPTVPPSESVTPPTEGAGAAAPAPIVSASQQDVKAEAPLEQAEPVGTGTPGRKRAKVGGMCGGIMGILCEPGLRCTKMGKGADMSGICQQ
jgi:ABC-type phosphate transport system substrate-binding protein